MKRSTDRILTTHVGSLIRTPQIMLGMKARALGQPYDQATLAADIRAGIIEVVHQQVDIGIDVPNDRELARNGLSAYVNQRLGGLEPLPPDLEGNPWGGGDAAEQAAFPDFFQQYSSHFRYLW